uniref:Uncharacterized protein n=1 Tax=Hyaloperonospora arabidopsidis (strain Emoy2) TaxID=559515 RepID=M4BA73_HYAAE
MDSLRACQSRDPEYSMSGVYASTRGRAQWYWGSRVVKLVVICSRLEAVVNGIYQKRDESTTRDESTNEGSG